jgi:hypothetical protein
VKRKNRRSSKKRNSQRRRHSKLARTTRRFRKPQRVRRKKLVAFRKRRLPTDPRVARALGLMRREGLSASQAARNVRMKLRSFIRAAGNVLYRSGPGKPWKAHPDDKLPFLVTIPQPLGPQSVVARNYRERKLEHAYLSALRMWREGRKGSEAALRRFRGKTVGGYTLITDTKLLTQLEEAGLLDFDNLYLSVGGGS